jgi:ketosteroid isomerase-like protein
MAFFSENYRSDILDSKAQMREYWSLAMEHGLTDEMKVNFNPAEIRIDGYSATTGKVRQQATTGGYTQVMVFKKEKDGVWRIVDSYT